MLNPFGIAPYWERHVLYKRIRQGMNTANAQMKLSQILLQANIIVLTLKLYFERYFHHPTLTCAKLQLGVILTIVFKT